MLTFIKAIFKIPFVRHITAGFLILIIALGVGYYFGSTGKAELKGELKANKEEITKLSALVNYIAKQPKTSVKNNIDHVKVKDGSTLDFAPRTKIERDFDLEEPRIRDPVNSEKQTPFLSQETKLKILKLEIHLKRLIDGNRRKKKQRKLRAEIERLRNPP